MCFMPSDSCPSSLETQLCRWSLQQQFPGRFWRLHAKRFARQPGCGEHHWVRISAFLGVKLMASASSNPGLELMQKYWNSWISFALLRIQLSFVSWFLCEVEIGAQLGFAEGFVLWIQRRIAWSATLLAPGEKQTLRANSEFGWIGGILSGLLQSIVGKKCHKTGTLVGRDFTTLYSADSAHFPPWVCEASASQFSSQVRCVPRAVRPRVGYLIPSGTLGPWKVTVSMWT